MATDRREFTQLFLCKQDEFRTNCFYFLPVIIPVFCRYAQNAVRPCNCGDQAVTHTHKKTTITLCLRARVGNCMVSQFSHTAILTTWEATIEIPVVIKCDIYMYQCVPKKVIPWHSLTH